MCKVEPRLPVPRAGPRCGPVLTLWGSPREKPHSHGGRNSSESSHQLSWRCTREHWGRHVPVCLSFYLVTAGWVCTSTPQCSKTKADQDNTSQLGLGTDTRHHCLALCGAALQREHMHTLGMMLPVVVQTMGWRGEEREITSFLMKGEGDWTEEGQMNDPRKQDNQGVLWTGSANVPFLVCPWYSVVGDAVPRWHHTYIHLCIYGTLLHRGIRA